MFCKYCGSPVDDGANFCAKCGKALDDGHGGGGPASGAGRSSISRVSLIPSYAAQAMAAAALLLFPLIKYGRLNSDGEFVVETYDYVRKMRIMLLDSLWRSGTGQVLGLAAAVLILALLAYGIARPSRALPVCAVQLVSLLLLGNGMKSCWDADWASSRYKGIAAFDTGMNAALGALAVGLLFALLAQFLFHPQSTAGEDGADRQSPVSSLRLGPMLPVLAIYPLWAGIIGPLWSWTQAHIDELYRAHIEHYNATSEFLPVSRIYGNALGEIFTVQALIPVLLIWAVGAAALTALVRKGLIRPETVTWRDNVLIGAMALLPGAVRYLGTLIWSFYYMGAAATWGTVSGMSVEWMIYLPHLCYWLLAALLLVVRGGRSTLKKRYIVALILLPAVWALLWSVAPVIFRVSTEMDVHWAQTLYLRISCALMLPRGAFYVLLACWAGRGRISLAGGLAAIAAAAGSALPLGVVFIIALSLGVEGGAIAMSLAYLPGLLVLLLAAVRRRRILPPQET